MSTAELTALPFPIQRALAYQELFELLGYDMHHVTIAFVDLDAIEVPQDEKALVAWLEAPEAPAAWLGAPTIANFVCFCGSVPVDWVSAARWEVEVADVWDELSDEERGDHRRNLLPSEEVYQLIQALMDKQLPPPRLLADLTACSLASSLDDDHLN